MCKPIFNDSTDFELNFGGLLEHQTHLSGLMMARCRSIAMAVSVNTETLTLRAWTKGQKLHMNHGRFQLCSRAAWN